MDQYKCNFYCAYLLGGTGRSLLPLWITEKITSREARIALAFEKGIDTLEEYAENKKRLKKAREDIETELQQLENKPIDNGPSQKEILDTIRSVYEIIKNPDVSMETKGTVMRDIVEEIVYDKEKGKLIFHLYFS